MEVIYRIDKDLINKNSENHLSEDELFVYCWIHHFDYYSNQNRPGISGCSLLEVSYMDYNMENNKLKEDSEDNMRYITKVINSFVKRGIIRMAKGDSKRFYNWRQQSEVWFDIGEVFVSADLRKIDPNHLYKLFQLEFNRIDIFDLWELK